MFADKTVQEFTNELASKAPVPGGGGVAALAGALSAALGSMVCQLTIGKKKYAEHEPEVISLSEKLVELSQEFLSFMDEDAKAFEPLSKAYSLPKTTPEEAARKAEVMEQCLLSAARVPLAMLKKTAEVVPLLERLSEIGSVLAVSDVACGAAAVMMACDCAALNIWINTKAMTDRKTATAINEETEALKASVGPRARALYDRIADKLSGKA